MGLLEVHHNCWLYKICTCQWSLGRAANEEAITEPILARRTSHHPQLNVQYGSEDHCVQFQHGYRTEMDHLVTLPGNGVTEPASQSTLLAADQHPSACHPSCRSRSVLGCVELHEIHRTC